MARLVFERHSTELAKRKIGAVYRRLRDAQLPIARLELAGIGFDLDGYRALVERWTVGAGPGESGLAAALGPDVNPRSTKQLGEWLARNLDETTLAGWPKTGTGKLATDVDALAACDLPVVEPLKRFKAPRSGSPPSGHTIGTSTRRPAGSTRRFCSAARARVECPAATRTFNRSRPASSARSSSRVPATARRRRLFANRASRRRAPREGSDHARLLPARRGSAPAHRGRSPRDDPARLEGARQLAKAANSV